MSGSPVLQVRGVGKVFPAANVGEAHAFLETKQALGKVLLQWTGAN